jgi:hypothetical protein
MEVFWRLLSERNEEGCKAKIWSHRTGDFEKFFMAALRHDAISLRSAGFRKIRRRFAWQFTK